MSRLRRYWPIPAAVTVIVVALVVVTVFLGLRYRDARAGEDARSQALSAATGYAQTMFGYKTDNVDAHVASSREVVVGSAKDQYDQIVTTSNLAAAVKKQGVVSDVTIQAAGVVSNTRDHAVVLIFMNQSVTSGDDQLVRVEPSRLQYSMRKDSGRWKIFDIAVFTDDSVRKSVKPAPSTAPAPASPASPSTSSVPGS